MKPFAQLVALAGKDKGRRRYFREYLRRWRNANPKKSRAIQMRFAKRHPGYWTVKQRSRREVGAKAG